MEDNSIYKENRLEADPHDGELTKCGCGEWFYISFHDGLTCERCRKKSFSITAEKLREALADEDFIKKFKPSKVSKNGSSSDT